jgi:hypothetical protein
MLRVKVARVGGGIENTVILSEVEGSPIGAFPLKCGSWKPFTESTATAMKKMDIGGHSASLKMTKLLLAPREAALIVTFLVSQTSAQNRAPNG